MGRTYYCEYCNRSFKDVTGARKKHLESSIHLRNRETHYSYYKDPEKILIEENNKKPCTRFMNTQDCPFGPLCRYSHYNLEQIQQLQHIVAVKRQSSKQIQLPDTDKIVKEFFETAIDPKEAIEKDLNLWPLPPALQSFPLLPPSLRPISYKDFGSSDYPEWGQRD